MGFDDDIRRHLQDTGEQVELSLGMLGEIRQKATKRTRLKKLVMKGIISSAAVVLIVIGTYAFLLSSSGSESFESSSEDKITGEIGASEREERELSDADASEAQDEVSNFMSPKNLDQSRPDNQPLAEEGPSEMRSWMQVTAPIPGSKTKYSFSGNNVAAHSNELWFTLQGDDWVELKFPAGIEVVGVQLDTSGNWSSVLGWSGSDLCDRVLVIKDKYEHPSREYKDSLDLATGSVRQIEAAALRVTEDEMTISTTERVVTEPLCLLRSQGLDAVEARIDGEYLYATDPIEGKVVYSLKALGVETGEAALRESEKMYVALTRSANGEDWARQKVSGDVLLNIGVVADKIETETANQIVRDGQIVNRDGIFDSLNEDQRNLDALIDGDTVIKLVVRGERTLLDMGDSELGLIELSGGSARWGRLDWVGKKVGVIVNAGGSETLFLSGK
tara:strand:+ start:1341 stop:2681 length:1341 start_codon:yes stop_codon:yes gene_type:complete